MEERADGLARKSLADGGSTRAHIAEAALFLASDCASMISGAVWDVVGGQLLGIGACYEGLGPQELSALNLNRYSESRGRSS